MSSIWVRTLFLILENLSCLRIHSDSIDSLEIRKAARLAGADFTRFSLHGSRSRAQAFDIILTGHSNRRQNGGPDEAASYVSEWSEGHGADVAIVTASTSSDTSSGAAGAATTSTTCVRWAARSHRRSR